MPKDLALMVPCPSCGKRHPQEMLTCPEDGSLLPLEGRLLDGKFRLLSTLGRGGMSTVWRAENLLVRKRVAIKLMLPELLGNASTLQRFRNEATSAGRIGNRHICDILDFGESKAGPFIVMEMLQGQDLGRLIEHQGRLPTGIAVWIVRQALLGLQAAHHAGIIHRDLKPENLFLHEPAAGQVLVKIMDFGISKFSEVGLSKTATGVIMGTPGYMSPEQIQGAANADERADLWAMGVMLYAAIAGVEPFQGETFAKVLLAVTSTDAPPLVQWIPEVDPTLSAIVDRCLRKDPSERFRSCNELRDALQPFEEQIDLTTIQVTFGPNARVPQETPGMGVTVPAGSGTGTRPEAPHSPEQAPAPTTRPEPAWEGKVVPPPPNLEQMPAHPGRQFPTSGPREGLGLDTGQTVGPREGLEVGALPSDAKRDGEWSGAPRSNENVTRWSMGRSELQSRTWGEAMRQPKSSPLKAIMLLFAALLLVGVVGGGVYAVVLYFSEQQDPASDEKLADKGAGAGGPAVGVDTAPQAKKSAPEAKKPEPEAKKPEPEAKKPEPEAKKPEPEAKQPEPEPEVKQPEPEPEPEAKKPEPKKTAPKNKRPKKPKTGGTQRPRPKGGPVSVDKSKVRKLAGYYLPRSSPPNKSHGQASAYCAGLRRSRFAGLREWQLPSASWLLKQIGTLKPTRYWSKSRGTRSAKAADLGFGRKVIEDSPSKSYRALCVARR